MKKLNLEQIIEGVESEGLEYFITSHTDPASWEDEDLKRLGLIAAGALKKLRKALIEKASAAGIASDI